MLDIKAIREDPEPFREGPRPPQPRRGGRRAARRRRAPARADRPRARRCAPRRTRRRRRSAAPQGDEKQAADRRGRQGQRRAQGAGAPSWRRPRPSSPICSRHPQRPARQRARRLHRRGRRGGAPPPASPRRSTSSRATTWRWASCSGVLDIERGVAHAAARASSTCWATSCCVQFALVRHAMDILTAKGFMPVIPPVLVREEAMYGTGFLPTDAAQHLRDARGRPVPGGHGRGAARRAAHGRDPGRGRPAACATPATPRASAARPARYGKDLGGMFRVHQFDKVEMFSFTHAGGQLGRARVPRERRGGDRRATSSSRTGS